jgi:ketosteroid isomerase-like protein
MTLEHDGSGADRDIAREFIEALGALDMERHFSFWDEDGVMEFPFQAAGFPTTFTGRREIVAALGGMPEQLSAFSIHDLRLMGTGEPGVFVAEFRSEATVRASGRPYDQRYICVIEVRDGQVVLFREYNDPQRVAAAFAPADV